MPSEAIDRVHVIAKKAPDELIFGDRNNNPLSDIIPFIGVGSWSDGDSAIPPDDDPDDDIITSNDSASQSDIDNKTSNDDITGVTKEEDELEEKSAGRSGF